VRGNYIVELTLLAIGGLLRQYEISHFGFARTLFSDHTDKFALLKPSQSNKAWRWVRTTIHETQRIPLPLMC